MKNRAESSFTSGNQRSAISKLCAIGLAGVLAISMVAMGGCAKKTDDTAKAAEQTQEQTVSKVNMTFDLTATDWDKSMPIIVHITGTTAEGKAVDVYHAFTKESDTYSNLPDGTYEVEYISPINKDGSLYTVPTKKPITIENGEAKIETTLTKIPAEQVTPEKAAETIEQIGQAVAKGDESLKGDKGQQVISDAANNAAAAPNVNPDTAASAAENASAAVDSAASAGVGASTGTEASAPSTGGSNNVASNTPAPTPEPTKTWVKDYAQVWVPNMVWVVDQAAWREKVNNGSYILCSCGETFSSNREWDAHAMAAGMNEWHSYSVHDYPATYIDHPEVGHEEDQGHYETVESGGHWE